MQKQPSDHISPFPIWRGGRDGHPVVLRLEWRAEKLLHALGHSALVLVSLYTAGALVSLIGVAAAAFGVWTYVEEADDRALARYADRASLINDAIERLGDAQGAALDQGQDQAIEALVTFGIGLSQFNLSKTTFGPAKLRKGLFFTTDFTASRFLDTNLSMANLNLAQLPRAEFFHADLRRAQVENATAEAARFFESCAVFASFKGAKLVNARFYRSNIAGASFRDANLQGARFENVTTQADAGGELAAICSFDLEEQISLIFTDARTDFAGANLRGAMFFNADLRNARGLDEAHLKQACSWGQTLLPDDMPRLRPCTPLPPPTAPARTTGETDAAPSATGTNP